MNKGVLGGIVAAIVIALIVGISLRSHRKLGQNLPPKTECVNLGDALQQAWGHVVKTGGMVAGTSGTPSMEPYITGRVLVTYNKVAWKDVPNGSLIIYRGRKGEYITLDGKQVDASTIMICHILADRYPNGDGIPIGLNNSFYERNARVNDEVFVGVVDRVFTWAQ